MVLDGFEIYQKRRGRATESLSPTITVRSNGALILNGAALELFGVVPEYVLLAYNPRVRKVAILAANEDDPNAYKLRASGKNTRSKEVGAKSFCEANNIPLTSRTYEAVKYDSAVTFGLDQIPRRSGRRANTEREQPAA